MIQKAAYPVVMEELQHSGLRLGEMTDNLHFCGTTSRRGWGDKSPESPGLLRPESSCSPITDNDLLSLTVNHSLTNKKLRQSYAMAAVSTQRFRHRDLEKSTEVGRRDQSKLTRFGFGLVTRILGGSGSECFRNLRLWIWPCVSISINWWYKWPKARQTLPFI